MKPVELMEFKCGYELCTNDEPVLHMPARVRTAAKQGRTKFFHVGCGPRQAAIERKRDGRGIVGRYVKKGLRA